MIASNKHDIHVVQIYDHCDAVLPDVGLLKVLDAEIGQTTWIDTSVAHVRDAYQAAWTEQQTRLQKIWTKTGIPSVSIQTGEDYVKALMRLLKM